MPNDSAQVTRLKESLYENPANRSYYYAALSHAHERIAFDALADIVAATPAPATCTVRPRNAISNLVRNGGLFQTIEVDGLPYEGTYEDLLEDERISPDAKVVYSVELTADGRALLAGMSASSRIDSLFTGKPDYAQGFLAVLDRCASESGGVPKSQIEQFLRTQTSALRVDGRTGLETVSPSFYLTNLEDAGALQWADGCWHITDAGACALAKWKTDANRGEGGSNA